MSDEHCDTSVCQRTWSSECLLNASAFENHDGWKIRNSWSRPARECDFGKNKTSWTQELWDFCRGWGT